MKNFLFLLLLMTSTFPILQLTASSKNAGMSVQKAISDPEVHGGKTKARHNSLPYPGLQLAPTVRENYLNFINKRQSNNGKIFGKNMYSWKAKYNLKEPNPTHSKIAKNEQQIGLTLKRKKDIEKVKPLSSTKRSAIRKANSLKNIERLGDSKTASENQFKVNFLKKLVISEHKRGISAISKYGRRLNQSNVLTLHLVNSCNNTKTAGSQMCELRKVLYKLNQLKNNKNISFDKEPTIKHKSNQSLRAGELSLKLTLFEGGGKALLDKIHFTKTHDRHAKRRRGKPKKKSHRLHFKTFEPKSINYKVTDAPKSYFDSSQSSMSSTNLGKSLNAINDLKQFTNIDRVNDANVQQGAANPYKAASENNMVADELTYGAAQLDQQQMLSKFQTQQRDAALQGRMTSMSNYPRFHSNMVNYPGPSSYSETPLFMSGNSFPLSNYRYPSWKFSLPKLGYQGYPYTISRRSSSFSSFPWSPMTAVNYNRFLYGRFNQGHGLFGYPRGFRFMPRRFYDIDFDTDRIDDDNMSNMESYNDFDDSDDSNNEAADDEHDDMYRRMAVSNFRKKRKNVKLEKLIKKDNSIF